MVVFTVTLPVDTQVAPVMPPLELDELLDELELLDDELELEELLELEDEEDDDDELLELLELLELDDEPPAAGLYEHHVAFAGAPGKLASEHLKFPVRVTNGANTLDLPIVVWCVPLMVHVPPGFAHLTQPFGASPACATPAIVQTSIASMVLATFLRIMVLSPEFSIFKNCCCAVLTLRCRICKRAFQSIVDEATQFCMAFPHRPCLHPGALAVARSLA